MDARFQYRLEKSEHTQGLRAIAMLLAFEDTRVRVFWLLGLLLALAFIEWRIPGALPWMLLGVGLFCIVQIALGRRQLSVAFDPAAANYDVTFDATGVTNRHETMQQQWAWSGLRRVEELPAVVILQFTGWEWLPLPNHLWSTAEERSEFLKQLRDGAPKILPKRDLRSVGLSPLVIIASIAAGFNFIILGHLLTSLAGYDLCSCAVRRSLAGQAAHLFIALGAIATIILMIGALERLRKWRPRLSAPIAVALILPPAVLGVWFALWFLRFL
jgi:hypothetical protein